MHKLIEQIKAAVNQILSALQHGQSDAKLEAIHADVRHIKEAIDFEPPDEAADQERIDALAARLKVANESLAATVAAHQFTT